MYEIATSLEGYKPGFYWGRHASDKSWTLIVQILDPSYPYYKIRTNRLIYPDMEMVSGDSELRRTDLIIGPPIDHPQDKFETWDPNKKMFV